MSTSPFTTDDINRVEQQYSQEIRRINDAIMEEYFHPVSSIYADLCCLKDTRMGLLLSLDSGRHLPYLQKGLDHYNRRPTRSFTIAYPELPYSEEQLEGWYGEAHRSAEIFNHSPDTDLFLNLETLATQCLHQNDSIKQSEDIPLFINAYPLHDCAIFRQYEEYLSYILPERIKVQLLFEDPTRFPEDFWIAQSICFLDDISRLCASEDIPFCKAALTDRNMSQSTIFAAYTLSQEHLAKCQENNLDPFEREVQRTLFRPTEIYFEICCRVTFTPFVIPVEVNHG